MIDSEFDFIAKLRERFPAGEGVRLGIGDDAAVVDLQGPVLVATDMLAEDSHWDPEWSSGADVGFKAISVNVSDIAAMGGRSRYATVALGAPQHPRTDVEGIVEGVHEAAQTYGVGLVGGDTIGVTDGVVLSVTVLGTPGPAGPITRAGARPGDLLCVTGAIGAAGAAVAYIRSAHATHDAVDDALLRAHTRPRARATEGVAAATAGATAMIDVSDGLGADANHLAEESGCGLRVMADNVPLAAGVGTVAELLQLDARRLAITGGEDYELLIAIHPHDADVLRDAIAPTPLTVVGEFTDKDKREIIWSDGTREPLKRLGWDHFA